MKNTFLNHERPLLTTMIQVEEPDDFIATAQNAINDGTDALGLQICRLRREARTEGEFRRMFSGLEAHPIYVTNYRSHRSAGMTDEARNEEMILAIRCGASLCDVMGDLYDPSPLELTRNAAAIEKQKGLIDRIHAEGGEVIMSSHIKRFLPESEVLEIALAHQERGADISKIVTGADTPEEVMANLNILATLRRELKIPFLFIGNGSLCRFQRILGGVLGAAMTLCVYQHDRMSTKDQPTLRSAKAVFDNLAWKM